MQRWSLGIGGLNVEVVTWYRWSECRGGHLVQVV